VNGTFANQDDNWQAASPLLANHGYCVFTFNYGGSSAAAVVQGTGDIAASAGQLAAFVTRVRAATGAAKVDLVGHSQGGMMPRYYLKFLTPYTSAFLSGPGVTNITLQNQCGLDQTDHLEIAADPVALADVLNALDPAHPVRVPCLVVLPITGPVGPVPSF
jgi:pimeloyl-ACP methyl ester carboxylesterase